MNLVLDDTVRVPLEVLKSLSAFRRWTRSGQYPDRGEYAYLDGELWAHPWRETLIHNLIKTQFAAVLTMLVQSQHLGRFIGDRMRLVHEGAGLSVEPDGTFVSYDAIRLGQVRFEQGTDSLEVIGTPDMVLEVVSSHSIQKDTVALRELYAAAGIAEYWLVNPLGGEPTFDVLRLSTKGFVAQRKTDGWMKSAVFGKSFRLELVQPTHDDDLPDCRLLVK
jgi:Uma2 family endonuclease